VRWAPARSGVPHLSPPPRAERESSLGDRHQIDLDQEVGVGQAGHADHGAGRRMLAVLRPLGRGVAHRRLQCPSWSGPADFGGIAADRR
jgi:hypothetical protein